MGDSVNAPVSVESTRDEGLTNDDDDALHEQAPGEVLLDIQPSSPEEDPSDDKECCAACSQSRSCRVLSMIGLNFVFFLVEAIVGVTCNSMALLADSFHMLSDVAALCIALTAVRLAKRRKSDRYTYGFLRAEVVGALVNSVFLLAVCLFVGLEAFKRFAEVEEIKQPVLLLVVGAIGLAMNVVGLFLFHNHAFGGHGHGHSHGGAQGHDHHPSRVRSSEVEEFERSLPRRILNPSFEEVAYSLPGSGSGFMDTEASLVDENPGGENENVQDNNSLGKDKKKKKRKSGHLNMQAAFLHILSDTLGSVIVCITAVCIWKIDQDWKYYLDPSLSLVLVAIVLLTTVPLFYRSARILLQSAPNNICLETIRLRVEELSGVRKIHDLHVWQLAGDAHIASLHVQCDNNEVFMETAAKIKDIFHQAGIHSVTIQPEYPRSGSSGHSSIPGAPNNQCLLVCPDESCQVNSCCSEQNNLVGPSSPVDSDP